MRVLAPITLLLAAGCSVERPPNPNDPNEAGALKYEALRRSLKSAAQAFNARKSKGEIDDAQYRRLIATTANELLKDFDLNAIEPGRAWIIGEVLVAAERWSDAEPIYTAAMSHAAEIKNSQFTALGRWVSDSLQLARVKAHLGKVDEAIALSRAVFEAPPKAKAPILPAILLEIVPAARGKGSDLALAELLVGAIEQHKSVIVDTGTEAGDSFLRARPFHLRSATVEAARLFAREGQTERARALLEAPTNSVSL